MVLSHFGLRQPEPHGTWFWNQCFQLIINDIREQNNKTVMALRYDNE